MRLDFDQAPLQPCLLVSTHNSSGERAPGERRLCRRALSAGLQGAWIKQTLNQTNGLSKPREKYPSDSL